MISFSIQSPKLLYVWIFILLLLSNVMNYSYAQVPDIEWQKCLGGTNSDGAWPIKQTSDGGFIVAGGTESNNGDVSGNHNSGIDDYWIVKLNSLGNIEWQKCLGGTGWDYPYSIQQTSDGGFIVAGTTGSNDGDVSGYHGNYDYWVVKLNSLGNIEWQKCLGGTGSELNLAASIQQTSDGGFIMTGYTSSNDGDVSGNHGDYDCWVVKLSSSGNIEWQKCFGGTDSDGAWSIQQTSDGGFIVAGETSSNDGDVSGNHGDYDCWVVKLSSSGNIEWQKCLGGTGKDRARSVQQTSDGGFVMAGATYSNDGDVSGNHGGYDFWVVKLNSLGNIEWQKCLGGTDGEYVHSIRQTSDGGFIVAGNTSSNDGNVSGNHGDFDYWVVKLSLIVIADAGINQSICIGSNTTIGGSPTASGGIPPYTYSWNNTVSLNYDTIANPTAYPTITTTYTVTVTDNNGCTNTDSMIVTVNPNPTADDNNINIIIANCNESDGSITGITVSGGTPPYTYSWENANNIVVGTNINLNNVPTGTYSLTVFDANGCITNSGPYTISQDCKIIDCLIDVPTGFSPNSDGKNDILYVKTFGIKEMKIMIFNREGEMIFQTSDMSKGWDGTYKGIKQEIAVYVYYLTSTCLNGKKIEKKGNITLLN